MIRQTLLAAVASLSMSAPALAQSQPASPTAGPPWPAQVAMPSTQRVRFTSAINGESYLLAIHTPLTRRRPEAIR